MIDWSAGRAVDFAVERVVATRGAVPYRWALDERSRFNPPVPGTVRAVADLGDPTSYLELPVGVPVYSADGKEIGKVAHVLAAPDVDIFDGLVIDTRLGPGGHRFVDAPHVDRLYTRGVVLALDAQAAEQLPEPAANAATVDVGPDDTVPDDLRDKLRRAWDWISGNY